MFGSNETSKGDVAQIYLAEATSLSQKLCEPAFIQVVRKFQPEFFLKLDQAVSMEESTQRYQACNALAVGLNMEEGWSQDARSFCSLVANASRSPELVEPLKKLVAKITQSSAEFQRKHEKAEQVIQKEFNHFIDVSEPINEGVNGLVYRMDVKTQKPGFKKALEQEGVPADLDSAVKVLKIYEPGSADAEFEKQNLGRQILLKAGVTAPAVPKAYVFKDVPVTEKVKNKLKQHHSHEHVQDRAELLMMDFIPGNDFQYFILVKVLKINGEQVAEGNNDSQELYHRVVNVLDLQTATQEALPEERADIRDKNMQFVYRFLKKNGVKVNPLIIDQFSTGIKVWEAAKFTHGDLHERNIMFTGSEEEFFSQEPAKQSKVVFLDFGPVKSGSEAISHHPDRLVLQRLQSLSD